MVIEVVVLEAEEGGWWAEVPSLPGCFIQAEMREELPARILESIQAYLGLDIESGV
jgi:predicted RNase H-like HicB family nuclease